MEKWTSEIIHVRRIDGGWPTGFRLEVFKAQNDVGWTVRFWKLGGCEVMHADTEELGKERAEQMMAAYIAHHAIDKGRKLKPVVEEDFGDLI